MDKLTIQTENTVLKINTQSIVVSTVNSVNGKTGTVVLSAEDVGADLLGSAQAVQDQVDALSVEVDLKANTDDVNTALALKANSADVDAQFTSLSSAVSAKANKVYVDQQDQLQRDQIAQVQSLAQTNELKIGTKADQLDLETAQIQIENNRLSILTKADIAALAQLALLVDTKADQAYVNQQIALLVGSAPEALNTIYELAAAIQNESDLITALNESVANRVRFDIATQALTEIQKQNARTNIDAEKLGTAQQLVSQITAQSLGAATAAQGAKADTALQSYDVAPVAFTGSFTSLSNQNKIFDVVFTALQAGVNTGILVTDTLGQMLAKLQAQIDVKTSLILGEIATTAYRGDRGKTAYDHSQTSGNVHNITTGQITTETENKWYTSARVLAEVLTGLSITTGGEILATDGILVALGKLQNQINAISPPVWVKAATIGTVHSSVDLSNLEFARINGTLRMRGWITVLASVTSNVAIFTITNVNYKIKRPITTAGSTVDSGVLNYIADSATIIGLRLRVTNTCVDATTAATSTQAICTNSSMAVTTHPYMPYGTDYVGQLVI